MVVGATMAGERAEHTRDFVLDLAEMHSRKERVSRTLRRPGSCMRVMQGQRVQKGCNKAPLKTEKFVEGEEKSFR